jgi:hypothetical protein
MIQTWLWTMMMMMGLQAYTDQDMNDILDLYKKPLEAITNELANNFTNYHFLNLKSSMNDLREEDLREEDLDNDSKKRLKTQVKNYMLDTFTDPTLSTFRPLINSTIHFNKRSVGDTDAEAKRLNRLFKKHVETKYHEWALKHYRPDVLKKNELMIMKRDPGDWLSEHKWVPIVIVGAIVGMGLLVLPKEYLLMTAWWAFINEMMAILLRAIFHH